MERDIIIQEFKVGGYPWFSYIKLKNRLFIKKRLIYWAVLLHFRSLTLANSILYHSQARFFIDTWLFIYISYLSIQGRKPNFSLILIIKPDPTARLIYIYLSIIIYKSVIKCAINPKNKTRPDQKKTPNYGGFNFGVAV